MNTKVLIGVIVVLVIVLASPLLLKGFRSPAQPAPTAPQTPPPPPPPLPAPDTPPIAINYPITYQEPPRTAPQYERQQTGSNLPPLTAETLVGTAWEVNTPYGVVAVELAPNGVMIASHPMVGSIQGKWSANGKNVSGSASFMGQTVPLQATIDGNTLKANGQNVRRLR